MIKLGENVVKIKISGERDIIIPLPQGGGIGIIVIGVISVIGIISVLAIISHWRPWCDWRPWCAWHPCCHWHHWSHVLLVYVETFLWIKLCV